MRACQLARQRVEQAMAAREAAKLREREISRKSTPPPKSCSSEATLQGAMHWLKLAAESGRSAPADPSAL